MLRPVPCINLSHRLACCVLDVLPRKCCVCRAHRCREDGRPCVSGADAINAVEDCKLAGASAEPRARLNRACLRNTLHKIDPRLREDCKAVRRLHCRVECEVCRKTAGCGSCGPVKGAVARAPGIIEEAGASCPVAVAEGAAGCGGGDARGERKERGRLVVHAADQRIVYSHGCGSHTEGDVSMHITQETLLRRARCITYAQICVSSCVSFAVIRTSSLHRGSLNAFAKYSKFLQNLIPGDF